MKSEGCLYAREKLESARNWGTLLKGECPKSHWQALTLVLVEGEWSRLESLRRD